MEVCDPEEDAEVIPALPGHSHPDTAQPRPRQAIAPPHLVSPAIDTEHVVMDSLGQRIHGYMIMDRQFFSC